MELAMFCRDSGDGHWERSLRGSEWTAGVRLLAFVVALPGKARQQLLGSGDKSRGKVACPSGGVL